MTQVLPEAPITSAAPRVIGFLGGGNMAGALIGGLIERGHSADAFMVVEPFDATRDAIARRWGVTTMAAPSADMSHCNILIAAVKPQQMEAACRALSSVANVPTLVSIAAGVLTASIESWVPDTDVVRVMPNTPALIGRGISALYAPPHVTQASRVLAQTVLNAVGTSLWVEHEAQIDAVTAISGSGPAYVFYFLEAHEHAALEMGLPAAIGRRLAIETFAGAAALAAQSEEPLSVLRERVTSKGGTTAAALSVFEEHQVGKAIRAAAIAAAKRSAELGKPEPD